MCGHEWPISTGNVLNISIYEGNVSHHQEIPLYAQQKAEVKD